jgi:hypothetical protein
MKSLAFSGLLAASLALSGNAAMAATTQVHKVAKPHVVHSRTVTHVAARTQYPRADYGFGPVWFFQSLFGGPYPAVAARSRGGQDAGSYDWSSASPSYDTSTPIDNGAEEAAQQASAMAAEEAAEASMQMAQEQNDEANAEVTAGILAAEQTEINANN